MTKAEFLAKVRFLFSDTSTSNQIMREPLTARPGNIIDGNNRIFLLLNRRIVQIESMYDDENQEVNPANYTLTTTTGKILFTPPPRTRLFVDYYWQKLTDVEIEEAIKLAEASGNFDSNNVPDAMADYAVRYVVANCYLSAASKSAEYYTMSAAGKQISKSELFNHYTKLSESFMAEAEKLRRDHRTDRGDREVPAAVDCASDWSNPYFPEDGGL